MINGGITATIVGVVGDVHLMDARTSSRPAVYLSASRFPSGQRDLVVRATDPISFVTVAAVLLWGGRLRDAHPRGPRHPSVAGHRAATRLLTRYAWSFCIVTEKARRPAAGS